MTIDRAAVVRGLGLARTLVRVVLVVAAGMAAGWWLAGWMVTR